MNKTSGCPIMLYQASWFRLCLTYALVSGGCVSTVLGPNFTLHQLCIMTLILSDSSIPSFVISDLYSHISCFWGLSHLVRLTYHGTKSKWSLFFPLQTIIQLIPSTKINSVLYNPLMSWLNWNPMYSTLTITTLSLPNLHTNHALWPFWHWISNHLNYWHMC